MKTQTMVCSVLIFVGVFLDTCDAAIVKPKAPDGGRQIVYENVRQIHLTNPGNLGGLRVEDLTISAPYRDYFVGLDDLASGHLLSAVKLGQWLYILTNGTDAVGLVELNADEKRRKALEFDGFYETNFSAESLKALRSAETLPQVRAQNYELRRLDIPAVSFVAVWLHGKSDDIIVPLPPTFGRLNAYQPYSEREIIKVLMPDAKRTMKSDETLDGKP